MNLFKKKKVEESNEEVENDYKSVDELTEKDIKVLKRLSFLRHYDEELDRMFRLGEITKAEYVKEKNDLVVKLDELCESLEGGESYREQFDDMMGSPYVSFPEIFGEDAFDKMVHDAIEECDGRGENE